MIIRFYFSGSLLPYIQYFHASLIIYESKYNRNTFFTFSVQLFLCISYFICKIIFLDRSWARRARGNSSRKRPTLLGADFTAERERPSSPSPLAESKPILPTPEEESKPKEWRQKIESWLQANESDQITDDRRQTRRITNRRSFEMDSESERSSTLDTLPEGKQVHSGGPSTYRRVYPDWKPSNTIDKTDVVKAMEVVEEVQPQVKDKSAWRKSTLNVPNSSEEAKDDLRFRHTLPRVNYPNCNPENILEDRKELISALGERPASDKLTLYIRKPSDPSMTDRRSNKVEIDQDNIETPPATRRVLTPTPVDKREPSAPTPCRRFLGRSKELTSPDEPEPNTSLGDGQFDRFSATRRTRRYKKNSDNSETTEAVGETQTFKTNVPLEIEMSSPISNLDPVDRESRLKVWQDRLKNQADAEIKPPARRNRNQTGINREDVKKALQLTSSQPIDIITDKKRSSETHGRKTKEHDNDEGFEETQSLMSESPSQGASSGGNYETDYTDTKPTAKVEPTPQTSKTTISRLKQPLPKPIKSFERNSSTRRTTQETNPKKSVIPRRSTSLRKTDSQISITSVSKKNVQRSNSRNSIISSRSSLNSATSTNTVRKLPQTNSPSSNIRSTSSVSSKVSLKRTPPNSTTVGNQRPPRPGSSFMKPTASSTTKTNISNLTSRLHQPTFRTKN